MIMDPGKSIIPKAPFNVEHFIDDQLLFAAAERGFLKTVREVLSRGVADVNRLHYAPKRGPMTSLHIAAINSRADIAELLLSNGANTNITDVFFKKLPIDYAIETGNVCLTKLLISHDVNFKVTIEFILAALKNGSDSIALLLLEMAPNIEVNTICTCLGCYGTALEHALSIRLTTKFGYENSLRFKILRLLITRGASVNDKLSSGDTPLHMAAQHGYTEGVEFLLANKAIVNNENEKGMTPLHSVLTNDYNYVSSRRTDIVNLLITHGASVNVETKNRITPLHLATENGYIDVIKILLDSGADINAKEKFHKYTALHIAINKGHANAAKLLIERNANLDAQDNDKQTPLHAAITMGKCDVVEMLLTFGATIDLRDKCRRTALYLSAEKGIPSMTKLLLEHGADINDFNKVGVACIFPIISLAKKIISAEILEILRNHAFARTAINRYVNDYNLRHLIEYDEFISHDEKTRRKNPISVDDVIEIVDPLNINDDRTDIIKNCQTEITNMKNKMIGNSCVSFYDVLTKNMDKLMIYAETEDIVSAIKLNNWKSDFPIYSTMIIAQIRQGQKRKTLINSSITSLTALSGYVLPDKCTIEIFNYLNNMDMFNLINAHNIKPSRKIK